LSFGIAAHALHAAASRFELSLALQFLTNGGGRRLPGEGAPLLDRGVHHIQVAHPDRERGVVENRNRQLSLRPGVERAPLEHQTARLDQHGLRPDQDETIQVPERSPDALGLFVFDKIAAPFDYARELIGGVLVGDGVGYEYGHAAVIPAASLSHRPARATVQGASKPTTR
jgi:hypothetical protein